MENQIIKMHMFASYPWLGQIEPNPIHHIFKIGIEEVFYIGNLSGNEIILEQQKRQLVAYKKKFREWKRIENCSKPITHICSTIKLPGTLLFLSDFSITSIEKGIAFL